MRGQLAGLWWVGAGRELMVLVTAKTRKQKPENPWLSGIFCWYVQLKSPTNGQSDGNNHRLR